MYLVVGVSLLGQEINGGASDTRSGTVLFFENQSNAQACIRNFNDDTIACQRDITGTLRLSNDSQITVGFPDTAVLTIKDDDS